MADKGEAKDKNIEVAVHVLDDVKSVVHVVAAALSVLLGVSVELTLVFLAYQLVERERLRAKLGDFVEWGLGLLIGGLARLLTGG